MRLCRLGVRLGEAEPDSPPSKLRLRRWSGSYTPSMVNDLGDDHFWEITGGVSLHGDVTPGGAKNAVTKQLVASLLTHEPCVLSNVPHINEVDVILGMLRELGTQVEWLDDDVLRVCT